MKLALHNQGSRLYRRWPRNNERGFLVIALVTLLGIMLIYVNANVRLLGHLKRELKLVEQKQIQRLERVGAEPLWLTNAAPSAATGLTAPQPR